MAAVKKYNVYRQIRYQYSGFPGYSELVTEAFNNWEYVGSTWARSEKQAINNVRHREYGDYTNNDGFKAEIA